MLLACLGLKCFAVTNSWSRSWNSVIWGYPAWVYCILVHCNCNMRQKLLSSKLFAAVVQHQILFGSNLQSSGLPVAKLAPGRWASGHGCWELSLGLRLQGSTVLLAAAGGFAVHTSLSAVYPSTSGHSMGKQSLLRLSSIFQQLLETFYQFFRCSTGSCERLPLPLWLCFSWQLLQLQASLSDRLSVQIYNGLASDFVYLYPSRLESVALNCRHLLP